MPYTMLAKIYLTLLILCGLLCQGIIGTLSGEDKGESSDLLVRQKRVINRIPGGDVREMIRNVPYIVFIREFNRPNHCPGSILSNRIIITAAKCVHLDNDAYKIHSGTSRLTLSGQYTSHSIIDKRVHKNSHALRVDDGIALLAIDPPFNATLFTRSIPLFQGYLGPGEQAIVSGWGCNEHQPYGTQHPDHLRSISVPIISVQQCAQLYRGLFPITGADICTLDPYEVQYCGVKDAGAPLVVEVTPNGPQLAGIHLWNGGVVGRFMPDVFVNLKSLEYRLWIQENKHAMEESLIHG